jgi:hypothetical protein
MQLMNQKMKAVKERAQAKNRADSRAVGRNLTKPSAEKGLGNDTLTEVAVQPDRSSRTAYHDDNSDPSDLDEEFANVPNLTKIRIYAEVRRIRENRTMPQALRRGSREPSI